MNNTKYHTVGTIPKSIKKYAKSIPLTHKDVTAFFPGLAQALP
jgi:hypothetical protein